MAPVSRPEFEGDVDQIFRELEENLRSLASDERREILKHLHRLRAHYHQQSDQKAAPGASDPPDKDQGGHLPVDETTLRSLFSTTPKGLYRMNPDWTVMRELHGGDFLANTEEPTTAWMEKYIHPDDRAWVLAVIHKAVDSRTPFSLEHRVLLADGGLGWTASLGLPVRNAAGEVIEWFGAFSDITERKEAEERLRRSEARQTYLLKLADALRSLRDPVEVQQVAARVLGEHLGASRVLYGEVSEDGLDMIVEHGYVSDGVQVISGRFPLTDIAPEVLDALNAGQKVSVPEIATAAQVKPAERDGYAAHGIAAGVSVPLVKGGRLVATLNIHSSQPRAWTDDDLALVEETAERTWAAVEKSRVDTALRDSQNILKNFFDTAPFLMGIGEMIDGQTIVISANQKTAEFFGQPLADMPRQTGLGLGLRIDIQQLWLEKIQQSQVSGRPVDFEYEHPRRDENVWLRVTVAILGKGTGGGWRYSFIVEDITARKQAVAALRESEERKAYLLQLNDAINPLKDPVEIQDAAVRLIAEHLEVDRAYCSEISEDQQWNIIRYDYRRSSIPSLTGKYSLKGYPQAVDLSRQGPLVIPDVETFTGLPEEERQEFKAASVRAFCGYALYKEGKRVAHFVLQQTQPRNWSPLEISLVQETAERAWAAVERARVEGALRASEERFRRSIEHLTGGFVIYETVREQGKPVDLRYVYVNQRACEFHQLACEELLGHTLLEIMPSVKEIGMLDEYLRVINTGEPLRMQQKIETGLEHEKSKARGVYDVRISKFNDGVIVVADDITERLRLEGEQQEAQLQMQIHHRLMEQREKERNSYAREIHDGPIQTLSSMAFKLQYLRDEYEDEKLLGELAEVSQAIRGAIKELRQVMNDLRPPSLLQFGLMTSIQVHIEALRERYPQITWNTRLALEDPVLSENRALGLYRIYQEAVTNIVRHSHADTAWIDCRGDAQGVILEIRDNGKGFPEHVDMMLLTANQHFGLAGMFERIEAIGGDLQIISSPGAGTTIRVRVYKEIPAAG